MTVTLGNISLKPEQEKVLNKLDVGKVLLGGVGSGKTYTSIFWYMLNYPEKPLIVITTAMKRDTVEKGKDKPDWQSSLDACGVKDYIVDSWNNIKKYTDIKNSVFIFDEQRVVGYGTWAQSFIQIARFNNNKWILLSATPGDVWMDYVPLFIANGLYKHKSDFTRKHVEWNPHTPFPVVKAYKGTAVLDKYVKMLTVPMEVERHTERVRRLIYTDYDEAMYKQVAKERFNWITQFPVQNASELTQLLRRVVNDSPDKHQRVSKLINRIPKVIIFYNYTYELEALRTLCKVLNKPYAEWNGQKHENIPETSEWAYLVQYNAGSEGWNCVDTDTVIFYSVNYSYKKMEQAEGRIDRLNTPFTKLYYYYMSTESKVDKGILEAVHKKKKFNEKLWVRKELGVSFDKKDNIDGEGNLI